MTGASQIVAIGGGEHQPAADPSTNVAEAPAELLAEQVWEDEEPTALPRPWGRIAAITLALGAIIGWTAFFGWTHNAAMLAGASGVQWIDWIRDWSIPVLLVGVFWLVTLRHSTREASRFNDAARLLGEESARLESRLTTVNRELSLAREFIGAQSRDLESLGRVASERLSQHADRLATLIQDNGTRLDAIGSVSETALDNMEKLRSTLPVIASSAKDVTNNIGSAGRTAHGQLEELISGFNKLNQFGQASEKQVQALRGMIDQALAEFTRQSEQLGTIADQRFATLAERGAEFRSQLDGHEVEALTAIRTRAAAMGEELEAARKLLDSHEGESLTSLRARLSAMRDESGNLARSLREGESAALDAWRAAITQLEENLHKAIAEVGAIDTKAMESARARLTALAEEATQVDARLVERDRLFAEQVEQRERSGDARRAEYLERLDAQMASLDAAIAERRSGQEQHTRQLIAHGETITAQLEQLGERMRTVAAQGSETEAGIAASLVALAEKLAASREALTGTDTAIARLTDGSVRLLELIQASVQHTGTELPAAMAQSDAKLGEIEARAVLLRDTMADAEARGAALSDYVIRSREDMAGSLGQLGLLHDAITERSTAHATSLGELRQSLAAIETESTALSQHAQGELRGAITTLEESARNAIAGIEEMSAASVNAIAERLSDASSAAIEKAMRARASEAAGALEQAAAHASGVSREAAIQLRDQLAKVNELAGNLERRVVQARERAEEQVDNDFARRVALITEALNSNAIDITRAIDTDVTDTAWASYLKGDRGIFTRRAVKLLDAGEAKAVAQLYTGDRAFRDHVSRYIHDFEGMLRQLLSTRDGHALGVTLLSSDMGKLYVALAQAIERLRN